jgi:hypothetical protein
LPKNINLISLDEVSNYFDVILNFFLGDIINAHEAKDSLMGLIINNSEISEKSIPHGVLIK